MGRVLCLNKQNLEMEFGRKKNRSPSASYDEKLPGWPGYSIFRILVPRELNCHLGCAFPLKALGKYEDIKAQIKFVVGPSLSTRIVMVSAKEDLNSRIPPAIDGLLRVNKYFLDWLREDCFPPILESHFSTRLLVPTVQVSGLINSSRIKSVEQLYSCKINFPREGFTASPFRDNSLVLVSGKSEGVHKAVEWIASYLRKFLVDQSIIPSIEMHYHLLGRPPHQGISIYGREELIPKRPSFDQLTQFVIIEMSHLHVQMSKLYADAIIGKEGAHITCIRRLTGATFIIEEIQGVPDQIVVMIDGSCSQVPNAKRLMLMFIAEAGGPKSTDSFYKILSSGTCIHEHYPNLKSSLAEQTGGDGSVFGTTHHIDDAFLNIEVECDS